MDESHPTLHSQPPIYTQSPSSSILISPTDLVLVNLAPLHNSLTYQSGHLGLSQNPLASLVGEVQVKWTGGIEVERPLFSELEVGFRGVEKVVGGEEIELCSQRVVLWGLGVPSSSSNGRSVGNFPGSTTPFKLELTRDLPHCLHFLTSSLEYTLTAKLSYANPTIPPILKCTPIHLVRSSPPGSLLSSLDFSSNSASTSSSNPSSPSPPPSTTPQTIHITNPLKASVRFGRTVYRRSEVIDIGVRVEIPEQKLVRDEGVRLRTVQAELIRRVTTAYSEMNPDGASNLSESTETQGESSAIRNNESRTILAKSGKSCRFSPTRPIVIRLLLHPSLANTCESITQVNPFFHPSSCVYETGLLTFCEILASFYLSLLFSIRSLSKQSSLSV